MAGALLLIIPLVAGYLLDSILGDPDHWPHPVRVYGDLITKGEKWLNAGRGRFLEGRNLVVWPGDVHLSLFLISCGLCFRFNILFRFWPLIHYYVLRPCQLHPRSPRVEMCLRRWMKSVWKQGENSFPALLEGIIPG